MTTKQPQAVWRGAQLHRQVVGGDTLRRDRDQRTEGIPLDEGAQDLDSGLAKVFRNVQAFVLPVARQDEDALRFSGAQGPAPREIPRMIAPPASDPKANIL